MFNLPSNSQISKQNDEKQIRVGYNFDESDICFIDVSSNANHFNLKAITYYGLAARENETKNTPDFTIEYEDKFEVETDKLLNNEWIKQNLIIKKLEEQSEMKM